ncbi:hypothetical protein [Mycoplasmoides alvi]|uniref:hypothetical protein n=1 Tax=Mycoplasmoides alvi TaxID=78580 RepID=UPI00051B7F83|nr:hypothetical protein [Mycoplasmoides alvi]
MPIFNNEYFPKYNREQTNYFTGTFINLLFNELILQYNLLPAIAPIFTNSKHNLIVNDNFRTIDFDNLNSGDIFKAIDFVDKWLYLYLRQSNIKLNSGIISLNNQINRDADISNGIDLISTPYISFSVAISKVNYCEELILNEAVKIKNIINCVISKLLFNNLSIKHRLLNFKCFKAIDIFKGSKKINLKEILIKNASNNPILILDFIKNTKFQNFLSFANNNFLHNQVNAVFFQFLSNKNLPLNFFHIALHPTNEDLIETEMIQNSLYDEQLFKVWKNVEWSYVVHINLANILVWLLDKEHASEIFAGPYGDDFYEKTLKHKKDIL